MASKVLNDAIAAAPQIGIVAANARAGTKAGLHSPASACTLFRQAVTSLDKPTFTAASRQKRARLIATEIINRRFFIDSAGSGPRKSPDKTALPAHCWNQPHLGGQEVCRVVDSAQLLRIMSDEDRRRFEDDFDIDFSGYPTKPNSPWTEELGAIPANSRWFSLPDKVALASNLVWFTQADPAFLGQVRAMAARDRSITARDSLGLVHFPFDERPVALFLLHLPGDAIQSIGHYRPSFADDPMHRRFMARSSSSRPTPSAAWGQTVDLDALEKGCPDFDGLRERVGLNLYRDDLQGMPIRFEFLGILDFRRGGDDVAACEESDIAFARVLAP